MKFIDMVCAAFFARVKPVSTIAKPACMNMTRKPATSVQTMLIAILLWPTVSITSVSVGLAASFTGDVLGGAGRGAGRVGPRGSERRRRRRRGRGEPAAARRRVAARVPAPVQRAQRRHARRPARHPAPDSIHRRRVADLPRSHLLLGSFSVVDLAVDWPAARLRRNARAVRAPSSPRSPVRMRTTSSRTSRRPCRRRTCRSSPVFRTASTAFSRGRRAATTSIFTFGRNSTLYSLPR